MALLAEQGDSVLTIARTVGFDSASSFNRAFRPFTGDTPMAYRRRTMGVRQIPELTDDEGSIQT
jgi:AraC-like DNA-binding protein